MVLKSTTCYPQGNIYIKEKQVTDKIGAVADRSKADKYHIHCSPLGTKNQPDNNNGDWLYQPFLLLLVIQSRLGLARN